MAFIDSVQVNGTKYDIQDTKNTAGAINSSSKLYLIGATSQGANPLTFSHDTAFVGTDGHLYSNSQKVLNETDANGYMKVSDPRGSGSFVIGASNDVTVPNCEHAGIIGNKNTLKGKEIFIVGNNNNIEGNNIIVEGIGHKVQSSTEKTYTLTTTLSVNSWYSYCDKYMGHVFSDEFYQIVYELAGGENIYLPCKVMLLGASSQYNVDADVFCYLNCEAKGVTIELKGYHEGIYVVGGIIVTEESAEMDNMHIQGKYANIDKPYAHVVGNGTSDTDRKNIHTLDWNGNAEFAGDVTANMGNFRGISTCSGHFSGSVSFSSGEVFFNSGAYFGNSTRVYSCACDGSLIFQDPATGAMKLKDLKNSGSSYIIASGNFTCPGGQSFRITDTSKIKTVTRGMNFGQNVDSCGSGLSQCGTVCNCAGNAKDALFLIRISGYSRISGNASVKPFVGTALLSTAYPYSCGGVVGSHTGNIVTDMGSISLVLSNYAYSSVCDVLAGVPIITVHTPSSEVVINEIALVQ